MTPEDATVTGDIPQNVSALFKSLEGMRDQHKHVSLEIGRNRPWVDRVRDGFRNGEFGLYKNRLSSIAWYGSSTPLLGSSASRHNAAFFEFGKTCAENNVRMVFGAGVFRGGHVSVMGAAPYASAEAGGDVLGVTTRQIAGWEKPLKHPQIQNIITRGYRLSHTLYRRINFMMRQSDAFVIAPGGTGTVYEHVRAGNDQYMAHARSKKPVVFYNIKTDHSPKGFWRPTFKQYLNLWKEGFSSPFKFGRNGNMITNTHIAHQKDTLWDVVIGAYKYGVGVGEIKLPRWQMTANSAITMLNTIMRFVLKVR